MLKQFVRTADDETRARVGRAEQFLIAACDSALSMCCHSPAPDSIAVPNLADRLDVLLFLSTVEPLLAELSAELRDVVAACAELQSSALLRHIMKLVLGAPLVRSRPCVDSSFR